MCGKGFWVWQSDEVTSSSALGCAMCRFFFFFFLAARLCGIWRDRIFLLRLQLMILMCYFLKPQRVCVCVCVFSLEPTRGCVWENTAAGTEDWEVYRPDADSQRTKASGEEHRWSPPTHPHTAVITQRLCRPQRWHTHSPLEPAVQSFNIRSPTLGKSHMWIADTCWVCVCGNWSLWFASVLWLSIMFTSTVSWVTFSE